MIDNNKFSLMISPIEDAANLTLRWSIEMVIVCVANENEPKRRKKNNFSNNWEPQRKFVRNRNEQTNANENEKENEKRTAHYTTECVSECKYNNI